MGSMVGVHMSKCGQASKQPVTGVLESGAHYSQALEWLSLLQGVLLLTRLKPEPNRTATSVSDCWLCWGPEMCH